MDDLQGNWIGNIFGTYAGNAFAEIIREGDDVLITLRINIQGRAVVLHGPISELNNIISSTLLTAGNDPEQPEVTVDFIFQRNGDQHLGGKWSMPGGHAGVLQLERANFEIQKNPTPSSVEPLQVIQRTGQIPKITIYKDEIHTLVHAMRELLPSSYDVVISANADAKDIRRLSASFWDNATLPDRAEFLSLSLTEPPDGIQRNINIVLGSVECSFSISGSSAVWVDGAFHQIESILRRHHSLWRKIYEKHALNINGIFFLVVLVLLPSLDLPSRAFLILTLAFVVLSFKWLHNKTTALRIFLRSERKETRLIDLTELATLLLGAGILAAVPFAYQWLKDDGLKRLFEALAALS